MIKIKTGNLQLGNLTEATSSVLTITGGTSAVIGAGTTLQVKQSSALQSGYLSSADWSTFNAKQDALTLGNLTEATSSVLTITGGTGAIIGTGTTLQVKQATALQGGYLSSADWSTFNGKQDALTFSTGLTNTANTITANIATGLAGGQTIYGGTAASENLTIYATAHATQGYIYNKSDLFTDRWLNQSSNTFIGVGAAGAGNLAHAAGDEGYYNTAIGGSTMHTITTANNNIAIGYTAAYTLTTGTFNTAIGIASLYGADGGIFNTAIGAICLADATGIGNLGLGGYGGRYLKTGNYNVFLGHEAGFGVADSSNVSNNIFIGYQSGYAILTGGNNNISIGYGCGDNLTTGATNLLIGYNIDAQTATASNQMSIGNLLFSQGIDGTGTTVSTGNLGVGIVAPSSKLDINGDCEILNTGAFYLGDPTTDGTWKIIRNSNNLVFQRRESGAYVDKYTIAP